MGETDGARTKADSYAELDEPGADPVPTSAAYDASSEKTAAVDLAELEPVETPAWEEGVGKTEHLELDDLQDAGREGWNDQPLETEAVELEDLEVLEALDPKLSNAPPALPDVGERPNAPRAPLPTRRKGPKAGAKAKAKPRSAPPPPPRPPTREESIEQAPKPMIGSEGWVGEDRISVVDFSAVLSSPPPARRDEPTAKIVMGAPLEPPMPAAPHKDESSGIAKGLLVLLLIAGVGAGAYFLGRRGTGSPAGTDDERGALTDDENGTDGPEAVTDDEPDTEVDPEVADGEPEVVDDEPVTPRDDEPDATMAAERQPRREEPRNGSAMSAAAVTMAAAEPMEAEPTMAAEPAEAEPTMAAVARMEAPAADLPPQPTREQVQAALSAVRPQVAECLGGQHATVRVRITVRGSGRITTAVVQDSLYARPPVGSCIARAVRQARFPEFSEESFVVLYPFQL